jgi:serine/threonine protein kinase
MKIKTRSKTIKRTNGSGSGRRKNLGGAAIAAGAFGCVFKPALKCKSASSRTNGVSKVLMTDYANDEMREISKVRSVVSKIPNYNDYFLGLDATICDLDDFTTDDKVNFDTKCGNLTNNGISSININSKLNKVKGINIPYGGLEFQKFFIKNNLNRETFLKVNKSIIKLLKNGIAPMNKLKLFHFDLKGPNILIDDDFKVRIIDWGLSGIQTGNEIPNGLRDTPFMYNMPFTVCLFEPAFKNFIKTNIKNILNALTITNPISLNEIRIEIQMVMLKWLYKFIREGGGGHYNYLPRVIEKLMFTDLQDFPLKVKLNIDDTKKNNIITLSFLNKYIIDELTEVVIQYTSLDGVFDENKYFNEAFKHNADVWGLLTCYTDDIVTLLLNNVYNKLTKQQSIELLYAIKNITLKYMFNEKQLIYPIDINVLESDLRHLNDIVGDVRTPTPPRVPSPVIAPPRIPTPVIAPPRVPSPVIAPPRIPTPVIAPPRIPTPVIAPPRIPTPVIAPPRVPSPVIAPPPVPPVVVAPLVPPILAGPLRYGPGALAPVRRGPPRPLVSSRRSKLPSPARVASKKKRVRHVTCDDAKKAHCLGIGKVCNEATGRCIKSKS